MRTAATLTLAFLLGTTVTLTAQAKSEYVARFPNGNVNTCENCHPGGNTTALNLFGQDSSNQVGKPAADWWPALENLDSDGDGQTNGQELGDPCGDWLIGMDPPRTTAISNPGDSGDVSADPDSPSCDPEGTGGTTTSSSASTGSGGPTTTAGAGGGTPTGGGQGGENPSSGAGRADPPLATPGSCSTSPATGGAAWDIGFLIAAAFSLSRVRRRKRQKRQ
ncbi:MAG: hypothetical protein IPK82_15135 [Polyangiaceae bacterium]|nr:hypothetical protein [Polyangiaceae bacterium]